jgi:response regulator RpfG family c-di-GMP phosphodiesterase
MEEKRTMGPPLAEPAKGHVLVVDDEPRIASLLCVKLSLAGYECQECYSGEQALERLAQARYDLILSDICMPGMSGLDLLAVAREKYPHAAFLLVTAESDVHIGIQAMKHGAADYLLKPFQLEGVLKSVHQALERKRLENELENYRACLEQMVAQRTQQLQAAMQRLELTYDETLEALGAALDLRDNETAGHSRRVTLYCLEIANARGLPTDQLKQIARGAYLHDIGKIGIPDVILRKKGGLTPEERTLMETHPRGGYELVCRVDFLSDAAEIVLTHQEKFDGTGYPQGLREDAIPLEARIFAVADTLDAMTSDRPYRRAVPLAEARQEIARQAGRQFDPRVVEAFLSIPEEVWMRIRQGLSESSPLDGERKTRGLLVPGSYPDPRLMLTSKTSPTPGRPELLPACPAPRRVGWEAPFGKPD